MTINEFKERIIKTEEDNFKINNYHGRSELPRFQFIDGCKSRVILTAPHSVKYLSKKDGVIEEKKAAVYTGSLLLYLHELTGCHIMYSNNYPSEYIKPSESYGELIKYVKNYGIYYLIDVLGLITDKCDFYVGMGINEDLVMHNPRYKDMIDYSFKKDFVIDYNSKNKGSNRATISRNIHDKCGIATTQFLISKNLRNPKENAQTMYNFANSFADYIVATEAYVRKRIR